MANKAVARSGMLWLLVNQSIAAIIGVAVREGHSVEQVVATLRDHVGPEAPKESVSFGNFRSAANAIEVGEELVLI